MRLSRILIAVIITLSVLGLVLAGCTSSTKTFRSQGETIEARVGDQFQIELDANASTGFSWELAEPLNADVLKKVGNEYRDAGAGGAVGAPGTDVWTFEAVGPGEVEIKLKYFRPWEPAAKPVDEKTFNVKVEE